MTAEGINFCQIRNSLQERESFRLNKNTLDNNLELYEEIKNFNKDNYIGKYKSKCNFILGL